MKELIRILSIILVSCLIWVNGMAQFPARNPSINDTLQSVRISKTNQVTFSVYAPKASEVTVNGDRLHGIEKRSARKGGKINAPF
jgi:hypothetical protein